MRRFIERFMVFGAAGIALLLAADGTFAATKTDYCYTPPGIGNSLKPNVMLVLDNSGSMQNFAYDFPDSDNDGFAEGDVSTGFDPNKDYYGYFKSDMFYTYSSSKFRESRPKAGNTIDPNDEWDGNFLNWLTMRRMDILRKVLTGGNFNASSNTIVGLAPGDPYLRGEIKEVSNPGNYSPCSNSQFEVTNQGSSAEVVNSSCPDSPYKIQVRSSTTPSGLLDDIYDKVRFGLTWYAETNNSGSGDSLVEGANVARELGPNFATLSNLRNDINEKFPETSTPLAEALWTVTGYFAQADTASGVPGVSGGPEPDYGENRYSTGNDSKDPFYYNPADLDEGFAPCAQNYVLFLTDGEPTRDGQVPDGGEGIGDFDGDGNDSNTNSRWGTDYLDDLALFTRSEDLRPGPRNKSVFDGSQQNLILYSVFAFGQGSDLIKQAAMNGGYKDLDGSLGPYTSSDCQLGQNNSSAARECNEWDENRDGIPDTYFEADNAGNLRSTLQKALTAILKRASSGSTVATISTQTRSGGELLQAFYLPVETRLGSAGTAEVAWQGFLRGLWTDPKGNLREDDPADDQLNLTEDRIAQFEFESSNQRVVTNLFPDDGSVSGSTAGDNVPDTCDVSSGAVDTIPSVDLGSLWGAGQLLAERDPASRTIWFNPNDSSVAGSNGMASLTTGNASVIEPYWTPEIPASETEDLIKFLRGYDNPNGNAAFRHRQGEDWTSSDYWGSGGGQHPWKLGSIITSTPRVLRQGAVSDYTDANGTYDSYVDSSTVQDRPSMTFVGANDGMLHAFYSGDVEPNTSSTDVSADLEDEAASKEAGKEAWAFMPENALPYLRWYANLDVDCHIPVVDYRTQLIDVATGGNWKTLLIGTMGFGGRSIECNDVDGDGNPDIKSSSIFVLDITDPENPELLWERSFPDNSLTLTYPAVVHKGGSLTSGSWYLVAGSGPLNVAGAGANDPASSSFSSNPSLFVYDLADGSLERRMDLTDGASFADSGKALGSSPGVALGELVPLDPDRDDITDSVYFGTYSDPGGGKGKLYRLQMAASAPSNWAIREAAVIPGNSEANGIAGRPFFAAPSATFDAFQNLWVYAGTGRFMDEADTDNNEDPQFFFGYIEDCWGDGVNDDRNPSGSSCGSAGPIEVQNDLVRTKGITVEGTGSDLECRCGSIQFEPPSFDSSTSSFSCPSGSDRVITDIESVSYTCDSAATNDGASCNSASDLRDSVRAQGGWYWDITGDERMFSQPFVRAGLVNILTFTPNTNLCGYGGTSSTIAVDFRTGAPPPKPVFLSSAGFTGDMDTTGQVKSKISLGKGVPPLGQGFAAMPSSDKGEVGALSQTSTGEISKTQKQTSKLKSGVLFLRSP